MTIKHLVISGGGPSMIQTLGVIQHLEDQAFICLKNIESIYGTSSGAIVGVLISLGYDWETINDYIIKRPWQDVFNISKAIQSMPFGGPRHTEQNRARSAATVRSEKQPVLPAYGYRPHQSFSRIIIYAQIAIFSVSYQSIPIAKTIIYSLANRTFRQRLRFGDTLQPCLEFLKYRNRFILTVLILFLRGEVLDFLFNLIEPFVIRQRRMTDERVNLASVVKLPPRMGITQDLDNRFG